MPSKASRLKRKAAEISSPSTTPVRRSSRVTKAVISPTKRSSKKTRPIDDDDDNLGEDEDGISTSDFEAEGSNAEDEGEEDEAEDEDEDHDQRGGGPQSYSIPLPKARGAGAQSYEDSRIHPNTFLFLRDLKANNRREWLKWNDKDYRISLKDAETFFGKLSELLSERDPTIPELPLKDIIFRIYRDVRFSQDQTPYKPFYSAAWSRTGRKGPYAAYYVQLQPGASFVGGGLWHPDAPALATIREDIDTQPHRLKAALMNDNLRQTFFEKVGKKDEKKVVQAFVASNSEGALKTKPKGFDADHKDLNLLRLRNFTLGKKISDADVLSEDGIHKIADILGALAPWVTYLNSVVMPDPVTAGANDDDDDEDDDDNDGN